MDKEKRIEEELIDLKKELEDFKKVKEHVRTIVGQIGGVPFFNSKIANVLLFLFYLVL